MPHSLEENTAQKNECIVGQSSTSRHRRKNLAQEDQDLNENEEQANTIPLLDSSRKGYTQLWNFTHYVETI